MRALAVIAATGLVLSACGNNTSKGTDAGGDATCGHYNLAFLGATSGPAGQLGTNMVGGINVALDEYNQKHPDCAVHLKSFDSQGVPTQAVPLATQIVQDSSIVGLVGPGFSGESQTTGKAFSQVDLPVISPSATLLSLTSNGWSNWHRIIGNDGAQGAADVRYLEDTAKASKVYLIHDDSPYAIGLAGVAQKELGSMMVGQDQIATKQTDFGPTVAKVLAQPTDAVFYAGYYPEASLLVKQLRQAGFKGLFMSGDGSEDQKFADGAGPAADGAILSAPAAPAPADFSTKYEASNKGAPAGLYSTQAYDATNIFLAGIDAGKTSHADMNAFIGSYRGQGISGPIEFDNKGDITSTKIYAYQVVNGKLDTENPTLIK